MRIANTPLHVVQRGHDKCPCFVNDACFRLYLGLLDEFSPKHGCQVHAYVLMPNHVHLLLTSALGTGCSALMKSVDQRFSQYVNRTMGRVGTLWQGRHWASPVEAESYFLRCHRYIEMNPVRAGLAEEPRTYPWSSFRANALGEPSRLVKPHEIFMRLGPDEETRRASYRGLFGGLPDESESRAFRDAIRGCRPVGSAEFIQEIERLSGRSFERRRPGPKTSAARHAG